MNKLFFNIITLIEVPFRIIMWIDFITNKIFKSIGIIGIILATISIPITALNSLILTTLVQTKYSIIGKKISFMEAHEIIRSDFPE